MILPNADGGGLIIKNCGLVDCMRYLQPLSSIKHKLPLPSPNSSPCFSTTEEANQRVTAATDNWLGTTLLAAPRCSFECFSASFSAEAFAAATAAAAELVITTWPVLVNRSKSPPRGPKSGTTAVASVESEECAESTTEAPWLAWPHDDMLNR
jgi:hypothetical protein